MKESLSVIIPVYGEKEIVPILYNRLVNVLKQLPIQYSIIYINDADPHGCESELEKIAKIDKNVVVINFVKNFGEEYAVKAGIDYCNADWAIIMDCDLQDKPEDIPKLYEKAKQGYDIVWGERVNRNDSLKKKFLSACFYFVFNRVSKVKIEKKIGSFSIGSRKIIELLKNNNSYTFNYIQAVKYLCLNESYVCIEKEKRLYGKSGYNILKGINLALKIIVSCQSKFFIIMVSIVSLASFFSLIFVLLNLCNYLELLKECHFVFLLILFLVLFLFGIMFFSMLILGMYCFISIKNHIMPLQYVIRNIIKN